MSTNQVIGGAGIAGGTWTIQSTNTATTGRYHDLSFLAEGAAGANGFTTARTGVLPGPADSGTQTPNAFAVSATGTGLNMLIRRGAAVAERSTLVGTYLVHTETSGTVTFSTADGTNPRIDRVDLQVLDGALGDNGGVSVTQFVVTTGVAAGSPATPAAPSNSTPVAQTLLPANTTTLTIGMISDKRRSAGLRGGIRVQMPGDSTSDVGFGSGEWRDTTAIATTVPTIDRWNSLTAAWETLLRYENGVWRNPGAVLGGLNRTTGTGTTSTTELQWGTTGAVNLAPNSCYVIVAVVRLTGGTTADEFTVRVRDTNTAGTERGGNYLTMSANGHVGGMAIGVYNTTSAESHTFVGTIQRSGGSGTATVNQPGSTVFCMLAGASGVITSA